MSTSLFHWWSKVRRSHRERALVARLLHLNDHHLADIGLRREQLQPDGIHELDLPPLPKRIVVPQTTRHPVIRPSLQGCG